MRSTASSLRVLVVACEPSADRAAARAVDALRADGPLEAFGVGGPALSAAGVELLARMEDLAAIGLGDVAARLGRWSRVWVGLREAARSRRPRVALLVDSPELNLPLARVLRAEGTAVVQYVGPQVWAWRRRRLELLRERTNAVALVLPFEKPLYDAAGVAAQHVGHPLLDEPPAIGRGEVRRRLKVGDAARLVALLPGSRESELRRLAGPLLDAAFRLENSGVRTLFAPPPGAEKPWSGEIERTGCATPSADLRARDLLAASDAALVASGTATLEAALEGTPLAAVYRLGTLSWLAAGALVRVPYVALPSWILGRRAVPEFLQREVDGPSLARAALDLLDPARSRAQREDLAKVRRRLGGSGAARRVARLVRRVAG
ncbi:MAG: lipid-A-disaccharide synthase [Polyangia bacterium]